MAFGEYSKLTILNRISKEKNGIVASNESPTISVESINCWSSEKSRNELRACPDLLAAVVLSDKKYFFNDLEMAADHLW